MTPALAPARDAPGPLLQLRDLLLLSKPRLSGLVMITCAGGLWLAPGTIAPARALLALQRFLNGSPLLFVLLYTAPPTLYVIQMSAVAASGERAGLIYGAPRANWILLADYLVLGLLALFHS